MSLTNPLGAGTELFSNTVTSSVTVSSSSESSPTTIISLGAQNYAAVPTILEWYLPSWEGTFSATTAAGLIVLLYDSTTELCRVYDSRFYCASGTGIDGPSASGKFKLTPSAGSHTYLLAGMRAGSIGNITIDIGSGSGGSGTYAPALFRALIA